MSMAFDFSRLLSGYSVAANKVRSRMSPAAIVATVDLCAVLVGVSVAHLLGMAHGPTLAALAPTPPSASSPIAAAEPGAPLPHLRPETVLVEAPMPRLAPDAGIMFAPPVVTDPYYVGDANFREAAPNQTSQAEPASMATPDVTGTTLAAADPPTASAPAATVPPADKIAAIALRGRMLRATGAAVTANAALGGLDVAAAAGVDDTVQGGVNLEVASAEPIEAVDHVAGTIVTPVSAVATSAGAPVVSTVSTATAAVGNVVSRVGGLLN